MPFPMIMLAALLFAAAVYCAVLPFLFFKKTFYSRADNGGIIIKKKNLLAAFLILYACSVALPAAVFFGPVWSLGLETTARLNAVNAKRRQIHAFLTAVDTLGLVQQTDCAWMASALTAEKAVSRRITLAFPNFHRRYICDLCKTPTQILDLQINESFSQSEDLRIFQNVVQQLDIAAQETPPLLEAIAPYNKYTHFHLPLGRYSWRHGEQDKEEERQRILKAMSPEDREKIWLLNTWEHWQYCARQRLEKIPFWALNLETAIAVNSQDRLKTRKYREYIDFNEIF